MAFFEVGALLAARECLSWWSRKMRRSSYYELARRRARDLGRPLVVVGDPSGGVTHTEEYGEVCVDLTGCPNAPAGVRQIAADLSVPGSIPLPADSAVVYVSCVLEYIEDVDAAWAEIVRVAGSPWNVVVVTVDPLTLTAYFYPGATWILTQAPPLHAGLEKRRVKWQRPAVCLAHSALKR